MTSLWVGRWLDAGILFVLQSGAVCSFYFCVCLYICLYIYTCLCVRIHVSIYVYASTCVCCLLAHTLFLAIPMPIITTTPALTHTHDLGRCDLEVVILGNHVRVNNEQRSAVAVTGTCTLHVVVYPLRVRFCSVFFFYLYLVHCSASLSMCWFTIP